MVEWPARLARATKKGAMVDEVRPAGEAGVSSARSGENARMAASVRVAAAIACALFSFLATNGSIYPGLVSIDP